MELINEKELQQLIKDGKEELKKIIDDGGKIAITIIYEKDKITEIRKIEPVNGKPTSSTIIKNKDEITVVDYSFIE